MRRQLAQRPRLSAARFGRAEHVPPLAARPVTCPARREIVPHSERANTAKFLEEVLQYVFTLERRVFEAAGSHPRHGTGWDPASQVDEAVLRDGSAIPIEDPAKAKGNEAKRGAAKGSGKAVRVWRCAHVPDGSVSWRQWLSMLKVPRSYPSSACARDGLPPALADAVPGRSWGFRTAVGGGAGQGGRGRGQHGGRHGQRGQRRAGGGAGSGA